MKDIKKIQPFFVDDRGEMSHLIDDDVNIVSVLYVTSKKGSVRANHYHKKDVHRVFLLKGEMEYSYRNLKAKNKKVHKAIVKEGEIIYTPPNTLHAMKFLEDSTFIVLSTEPRDQKAYRKGTVRVKVI